MKKLFDEIPCLEGERVILRKISEDDRETLWEMAHSDIIYRYEPTCLLERQYTDMDQLLHDLYGEYFEKKQNLFLGVFLKDHPSELCGLAEFYDYRDHLHMVSIGGRLREKFWQSGIATEIIKLMTEYLFKETDIELLQRAQWLRIKLPPVRWKRTVLLQPASFTGKTGGTMNPQKLTDGSCRLRYG